MARSRTLSPLFFKDEDLAECTETARLFFLGLTTLADREGRLEDRPLRIKGETFPYHNVDVVRLLDELAAPRQWSPGAFITRYEVGGRRFIQINNFLKYQHPHPNEPKSIIPPQSNITSPSDNGGSAQALPSLPSLPSFPSVPSGSSGVPPCAPANELDPHAFTQELVAEVQEHLPDAGVKAHPGLTTAVANLLAVGHPSGLRYADAQKTRAYTPDDLRDAVHGWILAEQGDRWHLEQRARGEPFTLSRLLTNACPRIPDYVERGRAGWGKHGNGVHGLEHLRAPPIEAPVDPEITARHQAREAERLERAKAWREEKPPEGLTTRQARQWAEEHKRRRP